MKHWLSYFDYTPAELADLVALARALKRRDAAAVDRARASMTGRVLGMVYFNPSLRTRASFEAAVMRYGGHAITLNVGGDTWNLEYREGAMMDGDRAEHIREAAPVLSRYCDWLGVRTFAGLRDAEEDARDALMRGFGRFATVPVINLESAMEHPCQGLADWMTVDERFDGARGRRIVITWAPQARAVPMAVPHSALLAAAAAGMQVTLVHPPEYELSERVVTRAREWCRAAGTRLDISHDQKAACQAADVVYVKSWGSTAYYGEPEAQKESFRQYADWMVDRSHLHGPKAILMHCLPVRRNVVIADAALDDPRCVVVDQAENRLWTQAAILTMLGGK